MNHILKNLKSGELGYFYSNIKDLHCPYEDDSKKTSLFLTKHISPIDIENISCIIREVLKECFNDTSLMQISEKHTKKIFPDIKVLSDNSSEGVVYISSFYSTDNFKVILKQSKKKLDYYTIIREYYVGISCINNLRQYIPTFMYTYGLFFNEKTMNYAVIYENVQGKELANIITENTLTFEDCLSIFGQVLLSLEIAQEKYMYSHYDLHCGNVLIKQTETKYSVIINDKIISVNSQLQPVIIDYGFTSVVDNNNKIVGTTDYEYLGIYKYGVSGRDIYQFLSIFTLSISRINKKLFNDMLNIFNLYVEEPYSIKTNGIAGLSRAVNEYFQAFKKPTFANGVTPMYIFTGLCELFPNEMSKSFKFSSRKIYSLMSPSESKLESYYKLTANKRISKNEISLDIVSNIPETSGYLKNLYNVKYLNSPKVIKKDLSKFILYKFIPKTEIINSELVFLNIVFDIKTIFDYSKIKAEISTLFTSLKKPKKSDYIYIFYETMAEIQQYIDYYYICLDLGDCVPKEYLNWVKKFSKSEQLKEYNKMYTIYNIVKRYIKQINLREKQKA